MKQQIFAKLCNCSRFRIGVIGFIYLLLSTGVNAQSFGVSGKLTDENGEGMPGVTVFVQGTTNGTISDINGDYSINVRGGDALLNYSFIGMLTQTVKVEGQTVINVAMKPDVNEIDEMVVVGYGTQKRISVTGAVNTLKSEDIAQGASSSSIATALTGRMPGTVVVQNSGEAGASASSIRIRGASTSPLILVDGVERDFETLDPDEIESITTLKDASATAVYGIRGGNGVIIVTTKRGNEGKAKVSAKAEFGLIRPGKMPDLLNSYQYAMLKNEGAVNEGKAENFYYSDTDLKLYQNGKDPILHPSTDWFGELTNDYGYRQNYNVNISGGHESMRYFTTLSYLKERDIYKDYDVGYDDRSYYERFNLRSNLDMDITNTTILSAEIAGQFSTRNQPDTDLNNLEASMFIAPAMASSLYNGKIIRDSQIKDTPLSDVYDNGYRNNHKNKLQFSAKLQQNLDFITKGLKFTATLSYDHTFINDYTASKNTPTYDVYYAPQYDSEGNEIALYTDGETGLTWNPLTETIVDELVYVPSGVESPLMGERETSTKAQKLNTRMNLTYGRDFGQHHIGAIGVFTTNVNSYHTSTLSYVPKKYMEFAGRASYNYADRYFVEFNGGYSGSEDFAAGSTRFGFFPAISAGWVITNERFIPQNDMLSFLKLRASYGTTGSDAGVDRFMYYDTYDISYNGGYKFGVDPEGQGEANQTKAGNPLISWSTSYQKNFAVETRWIKSKLELQADIFENRKEGIIMTSTSLPSIVATELPAGNLKRITYKGYELQASWNDKIGKVNYNFFANYNYSDNEIIFMDEVVDPELPYQELTGRNSSSILAFESDGFYSQADIDALALNGGNGIEGTPTYGDVPLQAGDIKYKDMNGDYTIDGKDKTYFNSTSIPQTTYAFGGGLNWKAWSLDLFFQGATDVTYSISGAMRLPYTNGTGNSAEYLMGRWTPERAASGAEITTPRMTDSSNKGDMNYEDSDFWLKDASYLRFKTASLSYTLKSQRLEKLGISKCKLYVNASNIYTWSSLTLVDPETQSGSSAPIPPNQVYTVGVNLKF